jgi:hypothetical protein
MTTLQLARRMAMAARHAKTTGEGAVAILHVLFDTGSWLRRVSEDANGLTVEADYEPTAIQPALFATKGSDVARLVGICQRIEQLATAPHWTADRRWRIAELAAQGLATSATPIKPGIVSIVADQTAATLGIGTPGRKAKTR